MSEKRTVTVESKNQFSIANLILLALLLAAGAVLRIFSSGFAILGMKPNFMIAMYCLAILLIRPKLGGCAVVGLLAGALCQVSTPSPYINLISELLGAVVMGLLIRVPMHIRVKGKVLDLSPLVTTFCATFASGAAFVVCLFAFYRATTAGLVAYAPIVFFTALINCVIVQILYVPVRLALKKQG